MATKSILKNITIRDKYLGRNLVVALENAEKKSVKQVYPSKMCQTIKGEKIKEIFDVK